MFSNFTASIFKGQVSYWQRQLESSNKEYGKRYQKLQEAVAHNVEELLMMVSFLESSHQEYVKTLEAGQRARVKRLKEEQDENLAQLRARSEAHIAELEQQTQKVMQVSTSFHFIWTKLCLQLMKHHLDYIESTGADTVIGAAVDEGEAAENREGTGGKSINFALFLCNRYCLRRSRGWRAGRGGGYNNRGIAGWAARNSFST